VRSSPNLGPFSRGSSSDGLPSAVNMSARRVVAMAEIIGVAGVGRQLQFARAEPAARVRARVVDNVGVITLPEVPRLV
jgi:hypothetical protein